MTSHLARRIKTAAIQIPVNKRLKSAFQLAMDTVNNAQTTSSQMTMFDGPSVTKGLLRTVNSDRTQTLNRMSDPATNHARPQYEIDQSRRWSLLRPPQANTDPNAADPAVPKPRPQSQSPVDSVARYTWRRGRTLWPERSRLRPEAEMIRRTQLKRRDGMMWPWGRPLS